MTTTTKSNAPVYAARTVAMLLGIKYTAKQLTRFGPPPEPLNGFITFFDPGWSILDLRQAVAGKGTIFYYQDWYDAAAFAERKERPRYRQVRMKAVEGSFGKTFAEQCALMANGEEIPLARVVLTMIIIHFLGSRRRLLRTYWVRTADYAWDGRPVGVGDFDPDGVFVNRWSPDCSDDALGVVVSRKVHRFLSS